MSNLLANITRYLELKGLSQAEFCRKNGLNKSTLNRALRGKSALQASNISRLARACGVTEEELVSGHPFDRPVSESHALGVPVVLVKDLQEAALVVADSPVGTPMTLPNELFATKPGRLLALRYTDGNLAPEIKAQTTVVIDLDRQPLSTEYALATVMGQAPGHLVVRQFWNDGTQPEGSPGYLYAGHACPSKAPLVAARILGTVVLTLAPLTLSLP